MNKNHYDIKNTFSNIHPSDECVERIFDIMNVNKKRKTNIVIRKAVSAALAFAIVIGSGVGFSLFNENKGNGDLSSAGYNIGGLMTVHAKEQLRGSVTTDIGYWIYTKDVTGFSKEEIRQAEFDMARNQLEGGNEETIKDMVKNMVYHNNNVIYATERGLVEQSITICGIDYPSDVKEIRVTNSTDFGCPIIEANDLYFKPDSNGNYIYENIGVDTSKTSIKGRNISLSGERYYNCRKIENPQISKYTKESFDKNSICYGKELATGRVFYIIYEFNDDFYDELGNNPQYDFTDYSDEVTISVEFKDGKTADNKLEFYMDKTGHMYCRQLSYSYK